MFKLLRSLLSATLLILNLVRLRCGVFCLWLMFLRLLILSRYQMCCLRTIRPGLYSISLTAALRSLVLARHPVSHRPHHAEL
ncbi:hypothetical protein BJ912DRAFT_980404 [Pholiota molesta]|nr:hypothetical protein BJ912DRAFT_980404 [Pholiota molesta]